MATPVSIPPRHVIAFAILLILALSISTVSPMLVDAPPLHDYVAYITPPSEIGSDLNPLFTAVTALRSEPGRDVYDAYARASADEHLSFHYPPTALLPFMLERGVGTPAFTREMRVVIRGIGLASAVMTAWLFVRMWNMRTRVPIWNGGRRAQWLGYGTMCFAAAVFYPLASGIHFSQLQTVLTLAQIVAIGLVATGRETAPGLLVAMMASVKPHYMLVILWGLIRRRGRFVAAACSGLVLLHGLAASVIGWSSEFAFWGRVLPALARTGESFRHNQSMNGLLHDFLGPDDPRIWSPAALPAPNGAIIAGTAAAAVVLLAIAALFALRVARTGLGDALSFSAVTLAVTMSPSVAWEHHYGCVLPALVLCFVLLRTADRGSVGRSEAILLVSAYALTGFYWEFGFMPRGIAGLTWYAVYWGGALMLVVLWRLRHQVLAPPR